MNHPPSKPVGFLARIGVSPEDDARAAATLIGSTVGTLIGKGLIVVCAFLGAAVGNVVCSGPEQRALPPPPAIEQLRAKCFEERFAWCVSSGAGFNGLSPDERAKCIPLVVQECEHMHPKVSP